MTFDANGKQKKTGCMDCNVDSSYLFEGKYSYMTQCLPLVFKWQEYLWISDIGYESKVKIKIIECMQYGCSRKNHQRVLSRLLNFVHRLPKVCTLSI